jgi:hypothetical protein
VCGHGFSQLREPMLTDRQTDVPKADLFQVPTVDQPERRNEIDRRRLPRGRRLLLLLLLLLYAANCACILATTCDVCERQQEIADIKV